MERYEAEFIREKKDERFVKKWTVWIVVVKVGSMRWQSTCRVIRKPYFFFWRKFFL